MFAQLRTTIYGGGKEGVSACNYLILTPHAQNWGLNVTRPNPMMPDNETCTELHLSGFVHLSVYI